MHATAYRRGPSAVARNLESAVRRGLTTDRCRDRHCGTQPPEPAVDKHRMMIEHRRMKSWRVWSLASIRSGPFSVAARSQIPVAASTATAPTLRSRTAMPTAYSPASRRYASPSTARPASSSPAGGRGAYLQCGRRRLRPSCTAIAAARPPQAAAISAIQIRPHVRTERSQHATRKGRLFLRKRVRSAALRISRGVAQ